MHSISEFAIYGAIEAIALLLLIVILLIAYNLRLQGRIKTLNGWLTQLKDKAKKLIDDVQKTDAESGTSVHAIQTAWPKFSQAALGLLAGDTTHRSSFVNTLEELNQCLDHPELEIPTEPTAETTKTSDPANPDGSKKNLQDWAKPDASESPSQTNANTAGGVDLDNLKSVAEEQKELIAMLLRQQTDAESAINIKVSELESLQRFHRESEVCVRLMEDELDTANHEIETLKSQVSEVGDMKALIRRFTQESSEMLTCIDTLEQEIAELQAQLNK